MTPRPSVKAKIASRLIEVFDFFAAGHDSVAVMDIVHYYDRPQSSTSDLLWTMVDMGLLYRDSHSRRFSPSPRLAALAVAGQPEILRNGALFGLMDRFAHKSRYSIGLFGMAGTKLQLYRWVNGAKQLGKTLATDGASPLSSSAVGQLLLSTLEIVQVRKMLWRLKAEAAPQDKFDLNEATRRIEQISGLGYASGEFRPLGNALVSAVLIPGQLAERPLALAVVYEATDRVDPEALVASLRFGLRQCLPAGGGEAAEAAHATVAI